MVNRKNLKMIKMLYMCLFIYSVLTVYATPDFGLGVNITNDYTFTNIVNHTNRYSNVSKFDSLGWPMSDFDLVLLDGRPATEWSGSIDDPEQYRIDYSGIYKSSFKGKGDIRITGTSASIQNVIYDSLDNTTYFEIILGGYPNSNHGLVFLNIRNTRRTQSASLNSGITELKVMRPGYELNTDKIFTDQYIALCKAANFSCYRFYNVQNIWGGEPIFPAIQVWKQRKTSRDACQISMVNLNGKRDGWCWEYIITFANIMKKDIWINIHMSTDSLYIQQLCSLLKSTLNPEIDIYVESSNEVWSPTQETHGPYNAAQAQSLGITFDENHARRTVQIAKWFEREFGNNSLNKRVRVIMAGQQVYPGRSDNHLNYIKRVFGEPSSYIYAISTALYFQTDSPNSKDTSIINQGMIQQIISQSTNPNDNFNRTRFIQKAKQWNLIGGCTSYEGGPHVPSGGSTQNLAALIQSHRTAEMGKIMKQQYKEGWKDLQGGLAMHFTLSSAYNRYGCWGLTDDPTKPFRNYKMKAIKEFLDCNLGPLQIDIVDTITCYNAENGKIRVQEPSNGKSPYTYSWSTTPTQFTREIGGLKQGTYTVIIEDANGCKTQSTIILKQPEKPMIESPKDIEVQENGIARFFAKSSALNAAYRWQELMTVDFIDMQDSSGIIGTSTQELTLLSIDQKRDGQKFRCIISNGQCADTTKEAMCIVKGTVSIRDKEIDGTSYMLVDGCLEFSGNKYELVRLYDLSGKILLQEKTSTINMQLFPMGYYVVHRAGHTYFILKK